MRGNHSAGEEEQRGKKKNTTRESGGMRWRGWRGERRRGEEETVIISSLSCESQPVLRSLPGKLEMHTNCLYSESVLPDSPTITKQRPFCSVIAINTAATTTCIHLPVLPVVQYESKCFLPMMWLCFLHWEYLNILHEEVMPGHAMSKMYSCISVKV